MGSGRRRQDHQRTQLLRRCRLLDALESSACTIWPRSRSWLLCLVLTDAYHSSCVSRGAVDEADVASVGGSHGWMPPGCSTGSRYIRTERCEESEGQGDVRPSPQSRRYCG